MSNKFMNFPNKKDDDCIIPKIYDVHAFYTKEYAFLVSEENEIVGWDRSAGIEPNQFIVFEAHDSSRTLTTWLSDQDMSADGLTWALAENKDFFEVVDIQVDFMF